MAIKTDEKTLERKAKYYQENKQKILDRKHERQTEIYVNKINRNMSSDTEFEKEFARKLSKLDNIRPEKCELCGRTEQEIGHKLELHHLDYEETQGVWVCKEDHKELDKIRRRE